MPRRSSGASRKLESLPPILIFSAPAPLTDLQLRERRIDEIVRAAGIESEQHRVLRQQLDGLDNFGIEVCWKLIERVRNNQ